MTDVPSNLIPTRISQLPEYTGSSQEGYLPYVYQGVTYKVRFSSVASAGEVPPSRTLTAGTGLTGGGDLSADRVFAIASGGVGADQLDATGVVAGVYGDASNVPTITVDANGRVSDVSTTPIVALGYVPESRVITAGAGLSGGGNLAGDRSFSVNFSSVAPSPLGSASAGVANVAAREDHVHPAVDLSDMTETQGTLPLGRGGTGASLSPIAGAVAYSTGTHMSLTPVGVAGQVLVSGGVGAPYWLTLTGTGTVTSVNVDGGTSGLNFIGGPITTAGVFTLQDPGFIQFDTAYGASRNTGRLWWNDDDNAKTLMLGGEGSDVDIKVGEQNYFRIKASAAITKGQVVMFTGTVGASGGLQGAPATGLTVGTSSYIMGVAAEDIPLNGWGYVTEFGLIRQLDTTAFSDGDILYYDPSVAGGLRVGAPPAPAAKAEMAAVVLSASNGSIFVRATSHFSIEQLNDVETAAASDLDLLEFNGASGVWRHRDPQTINVGGATNVLNGAANQIVYQTGSGSSSFIAAPSTANTFLEWSGSAFQWSSNPLGTVTSVDVSGGTTGLTASGGPITSSGTITLGGTLGVANGGTGATTAAGALTSLGAYPASNPDGYTTNTGTVTSVAATAGTGISVSGSPITTSGTLTITNTAPDQTVTLTQGGTTTITGTYPNFTISSADQYDGTVTSVAATVPTGFTVGGSPITTSGTLAIGFDTGYSLPTDAEQANWDTAYTDRYKWDGGSSGLVAATGRTSLGLGTSAVLDAGAAGGVATLDGGGTVPTSQLPAAVLGALKYQGTWNASTNSPTLTSSVGTQGYYYVVSVAGTTNLDGISDWAVGDWAIFNGSTWDKIDNTDAVTSVNGYTGTVVLDYADVGAPSTTGTGASGTWGINVTGNAANVTGTVAVANGGTGATTAAGALTNLGAYAASNPAGYTTNTGTVTSVAASAGTGISITGSPITTSGTLTITNTAPDQTVTLTQAGTTTITGTYPNFTISSADQYSGTVTSVGGTGTVNGLTLSGTVTSSGNLTLGGTLAISNADWSGTDLSVANGGTGASTAAGALANLGAQAAATALTTSTTFGGDVSGTYNAIVVADDSHNHIISNVDGLQTALNAKQDSATALTTSTTFSGDVSGTYNAIVVADDSHNHVISNVDGLQTALDAKAPTVSPTFTGTITAAALNMGNGNITNVNHIVINDPGVGEGIQWAGGNGWQIYESPDGLTNAAGNLQFVTGSTRRATIDTNGNIFGISSVRAPIFYDSNNTAYYVDPAATSVLNGADFDGIVRIVTGSVGPANTTDGLMFDGNYTNGQYRHRFRKRDDSGGIPLYLDYAAGTANSYTELMKFGPNTADGSYLTVYGQGYATGNFRAPIFYDSDNTGYYIDPASTSASLVAAGPLRSGPATALPLSYASNFSANGASIQITLERTGTSVGWGGIGADINNCFAAWNSSAVSQFRVTTSGAAFAVDSFRAPIFYDSGNTAYYLDASSTGTSLNVAGTAVAPTFNATSTVGGGFQGIDGDSATAPSFTWTSDLNSGMWKVADDVVGITAGGNDEFRVYTSYTLALGSSRAPIFYDSDNTGYYYDGAGTTRVNFCYANNFSNAAGDGAGLRFWNDTAYSIYMSSTANGTWGGRVAGEATSDYNMYFRMSNGTNRGFVFRNNTTNVAGIDASGNGRFIGDVVAYSSSDARLKENLEVIPNALDKVSSLTGYTFDWNDKQTAYEAGKRDVGIVAQDVEAVLPEVVVDREETGYKAVNYEKLVPLLIEAIKELKAEVETLKKG